jgi:hypothetical protein
MFLPAWNSPACELYICFTSLADSVLLRTLGSVILHRNAIVLSFLDPIRHTAVEAVFAQVVHTCATQFMYNIMVVVLYVTARCVQVSSITGQEDALNALQFHNQAVNSVVSQVKENLSLVLTALHNILLFPTPAVLFTHIDIEKLLDRERVETGIVVVIFVPLTPSK